MNVDQMFPSKYMKASDLDGKDWHLVIDHVEMETVGKTGDDAVKPIVYFKGAKKGFVCNKTNMQTIAKVVNDNDTDGWTGKAITLFATEVEFQGNMVLAIRVRLRAPKMPVSATKTEKAPVAATQPEEPADDLRIPEDDIPF